MTKALKELKIPAAWINCPQIYAKHAKSPRGRKILRWKRDAIADGWTHKAAWKHDPEYIACELKKEGFIANLVTANFPYQVHIVGPDSFEVNCPFPYSWKQLNRNLQLCSICGKTNIKAVHCEPAPGYDSCRVCRDCVPALVVRIRREAEQRWELSRHRHYIYPHPCGEAGAGT